MVENSPHAVREPAAPAALAKGGPALVQSKDEAVQVESIPAEITRLVAEHHAVLYGFAYRLTGSVHDAEDLTQQTFLAAQAGLAGLRQAESARGWLFAILRNAWLKSRRKPSPISAADLELSMDHVPDEMPESNTLDPDRLQAAIDQLPDEFKLVVTMFYFQDCSYRQIAAELDLPIGTVMSRLSRAKGHLRARLFEPELHAAVSGSHGSTK